MLGLLVPTRSDWVAVALGNVPMLLRDHAHCEMKAASNALSLGTRYPWFPNVVRALSELAREELLHFEAVLSKLEQRGIALGAPEVDTYASELRKAALLTAPRTTDGSLIDRLLVASFIEARSCERFKLLSEGFREHGAEELADFYRMLLASEARHHALFFELATSIAGDVEGVRKRAAELAILEGKIVVSRPPSATIHG